MQINIFKRRDIFDKLIRYGNELITAWDTYNDYDGAKSEWWFDPRKTHLLENPVLNQPREKRLRKRNQLNYDQLNYELYLYPPNYLTLLLVNLLYSNKKGILIEDACAGMGRLIFYLSKCGYTNFSIIEDFSQITKFLMEGTLVTAGIKYLLNDFTTAPTVINIAGYPVYPKNNIPNSVELFCCYGNEAIIKNTGKMLKENYRLLCFDHNNISLAFCRKDKYDDFYNIIKSLEFKDSTKNMTIQIQDYLNK